MEETSKQQPESGGTAPSMRSFREAQAHAIVKKHSLWATGAGAIPVPGLDIAAFTLVNLRMIRELAGHYDLPFNEHVAKGVLASLLGGASASFFGRSLLTSLIKGVPIIGSAAGVLSGSVAMVALSRTVGKLFIEHFETGGTLLTFDAKAVRGHFMREFEKSKAEGRSPSGADKPVA
jgi:uncharacterized protein (DUF697 family)